MRSNKRAIPYNNIILSRPLVLLELGCDPHHNLSYGIEIYRLAIKLTIVLQSNSLLYEHVHQSLYIRA